MADVRIRSLALASVVLLLAAAQPEPAHAGQRGERCVFSPDGVALHRPSGGACGDLEVEKKARAQARRRGETNDFEVSTEIPPANPFVPGDPHARLGRGSWQPAEVGTRKLYRHSLKRTLYAGPHLARTVRYHGDRNEEFFFAGEGFGAARVEVRITDRLLGDPGAGNIHETQRHYIVPGASHNQLVASEMAVRGKRVVVRQPEASALLAKGAKPGEPWPAGVHVIDNLAFEREGEVMGVQGVDTPLGRFENCLVVRYSSKLAKAGPSPLGDGTRVVSGKVVTTEWIARGVGRVQMRQHGDLELSRVHDMPGRLTFEARSQLHQLQRLADRRDSNPVAALDTGAKARARKGWATGSWRLSLDPEFPLGAELPMDVIRIRPDAKVDLANRSRVYASCPFEVRGDVLTVHCRSQQTFEPIVFDLVLSPDQKVLTTATGSQYARQ